MCEQGYGSVVYWIQMIWQVLFMLMWTFI